MSAVQAISNARGFSQAVASIDSQAVTAVNAFLSAQDEVLAWQCWGRQYRLRWRAPAERRYLLVLHLRVSTHEFAFALADLAAIDPLLIGDPFARLPQIMRERVIQRLSAQALVALPMLSDCTQLVAIEWDCAVPLSRWPCQVGFDLDDESRSLSALGMIAANTPAAMQWLQSRFVRSSPAAPLRADLPVPVWLSLGHAFFAPSDLSQLERGDVAWIADADHSRRGIRARLSTPDGRWEFVGRVQRNEFSGLERNSSHLRTTAQRGGGLMEQEHRVASIKIPVTFDIGELSIALQDLERMQAGHTVELPQDIGSAQVHLRVSGQIIATGELVCVGRRLGVRMTDVRALREKRSVSADQSVEA